MITLKTVLLKLNKKVSHTENKIAVESKLGIIKIEKDTNIVVKKIKIKLKIKIKNGKVKNIPEDNLEDKKYTRRQFRR